FTKELLKQIKHLLSLVIFLVLVIVVFTFINVSGIQDISRLLSLNQQHKEVKANLLNTINDIPAIAKSQDLWHAPEERELQNDANEAVLSYGRELISNTSVYFGPNGKLASISNGMNCQNCHLNAGTIPFGNNYGAVFSSYPKYRARSGKIEDIYKRITDCFERSLNGKAPDTSSKEMKSMASYINWVGKTVPKSVKPKGSGIYELPYLDRAADSIKGKILYKDKCQSCHLQEGTGQFNFDKTAYLYPPLWGPHSYNSGAGLNRLSRLAGYIKANMPFGASYNAPQLTDEDSWDIAGYIASKPRPHKVFNNDWPKINEKPIDHPFGPYIDRYTEEQHKFGPFKPIKKELDDLKKKKQASI
ncbi:MAG TPA: c-type cytochrome, partial [Saprospiraceae bacterium]|nr:c-type cytochrome [Saprospiraceae bacterium]